MAYVPGFLQLPSDGSGKKFGTSRRNQGADGEVHDQVVAVPDEEAVGSITATDAVVPASATTGNLVSGTPTAGSYVALALAGGDAAWAIQITGTWTGTLYVEGSVDSTDGINGNWAAVLSRRAGAGDVPIAATTTANGILRGNLAGIRLLRIRAVGAWTGTAAVVIRTSWGTGDVFLNGSIPTGSNTIGKVAAVPTRQVAYSAPLPEHAPTITAGVKPLTTWWHPSTITRDAFIEEIVLYALVTTAGSAGRSNLEAQFFTAEAGTPGGTAITPQALDPSNAATAVVVRHGLTAAPTLTGQLVARIGAFPPTTAVGRHEFVVYRQGASSSGQIVIRAGTAFGIYLTMNTVVAHTALAYTVTGHIRWTEI